MDAYVTPTIARYRLQLPYISHRTYLTNRMGSISHHIMPLVINSLGGGHTHTQTHTRACACKHTCTHTFVDRSNSKKLGKAGAPGLKNIDGLTALQNLLADKTSEDWS